MNLKNAILSNINDKLSPKTALNEEFNQVQMDMGEKVEREHLDTYNWIARTLKETGKLPMAIDVFKHIAMDHLKEDPNYYTHLSAMENKYSKDKE